MHMSSLEVQSIRSLERLTTDHQPGVNVLAGRNNTAKSNILLAIRQALAASSCSRRHADPAFSNTSVGVGDGC
jgi:recombinational DNA repair ATPase RecF